VSADVRVVGMVRGRDIAREARFSVEEQAVVLAWRDAAPWRLGFDGIDGLQAGPTSLTLYLQDHDVLELTGNEELRPVSLRLLDKATRMPELTRGLRGLGAMRLSDAHQRAHDRWFAPLLQVRRAVQHVSDPLRQVALMEGTALAVEMERAIAEIAATLAPGDAAEQRAIEAALEDEAEPLFRALSRLAIAGESLRGGEMDTRLADWRRWVGEARKVFAEADEAWRGFEIEGAR
jgi:hypothetical protein